MPHQFDFIVCFVKNISFTVLKKHIAENVCVFFKKNTKCSIGLNTRKVSHKNWHGKLSGVCFRIKHFLL